MSSISFTSIRYTTIVFDKNIILEVLNLIKDVSLSLVIELICSQRILKCKSGFLQAISL